MHKNLRMTTGAHCSEGKVVPEAVDLVLQRITASSIMLFEQIDSRPIN